MKDNAGYGQRGGSFEPANAHRPPGLAEAPTGRVQRCRHTSFTGFNWYAGIPNAAALRGQLIWCSTTNELETVLTVNYVDSEVHRLDVVSRAITGKEIPSEGRIIYRRVRLYKPPYHYISPATLPPPSDKAEYNALHQARLNGRASCGCVPRLLYVVKALDLGCTGCMASKAAVSKPYILKNDKGPAGTRRAEIFSAAWVYELNLARGISLLCTRSD